MSPADPESPPADLHAALTVYVEPLANDARVAIVGPHSLTLAEQLLELGARTVNVYDPDAKRASALAEAAPRGVSVRALAGDFDVRDGAFDLVVISDLGAIADLAGVVGRLRRVLDPRGAVVALGRARTQERDPRADEGAFSDLAAPAVEYAELYDLFALQFDTVTMNGVLPFSGVVFAELGITDDLAVSVDTRLVDPEPPGVFAVVASREGVDLDPYSIVQIAPTANGPSTSAAPSARDESRARLVDDEARSRVAEAAFAALQIKAELLSAQLDEHRARLGAAEGAAHQFQASFEALAVERDVAISRAAELEAILAAAQQALAMLERRAIAAEQGMLERDDQIAALNAELDARGGLGEELSAVDPALLAEVLERAERAEASLALHVADLAQVGEAHAADTAAIEAQLRERAGVIKEMERELRNREQLVKELVATLEEAREGAPGPAFQAAPVVQLEPAGESLQLRRKLDELALEVARREGELQAQAWRVTELENELARARSGERSAPSGDPMAGRAADLERDLMRSRDELDALRQALTQEHAARVAAESGEELSRARAELARQQVLLEQLRGKSVQPG